MDYRTGSYRVGGTYFVCFEERKLTTFIRWLLWILRRRHLRFVLPLSIGRTYRQQERADSVFYTGLYFRVFANSNQQKWPGKDTKYLTSQAVRTNKSAIMAEDAPVTFQRALDVICVSVRWPFALVYLSRIFLFLKPCQNHTEEVMCVLWLLYSTGVTLELKASRSFPRRSTI